METDLERSSVKSIVLEDTRVSTVRPRTPQPSASAA